MFMNSKILLTICVGMYVSSFAQPQTTRFKVNNLSEKLESKVVEWRRDFHEHPELGNQENRTAGIVAKHLQALGMEVKTGIAKTGVVGILKGGKPGPVVA